MMLLFFIQVFVSISSLSKSQDILVSKCTKPEPEMLVINCSLGRVINVREAIYVRNKWEECMYMTGDCTEKVEINELCCGQSNCSFPIRKAYSLTCGYVTFFRMIYECAKEKDLTCGTPVTHTSGTTDKPELTSHHSMTLTNSHHSMTLTTQISNDVDTEATKQPTEDHTGGDMPIIIGSAVTVAVLLVVIFVVLFLLRWFSWEKEKFCIFGIFISLCKRQPPDGSEEPDELQNGTRHDAGMSDQTGKETKMKIDSNQNVQTSNMPLLCRGKIYANMEEGIIGIPTLSAVIDEKRAKTPCRATQVHEGVTDAMTTDV